LVTDLKRRGAGQRESGAFLLGRRTARSVKVIGYRCYDDLDPTSLDTGAVNFHAQGYAALWAHCRKKRLEVLADVHTHPGDFIQQSDIDRAHPMIPQVGHVAIILPHFGNITKWSLRDAGIYQYKGNFQWGSFSPTGCDQPLTLCIW